MNPKRLLTHIVLARRHDDERESMRRELEAHIRKALSKEHLTRTVREKVAEIRRRDAMRAHLATLESELFAAAGTHLERADLIRSRIQALRKKMEKE